MRTHRVGVVDLDPARLQADIEQAGSFALVEAYSDYLFRWRVEELHAVHARDRPVTAWSPTTTPSRRPTSPRTDVSCRTSPS